MSEEKFLAFKGLKQYDPGMGWAQVHNFNNSQSSSTSRQSQAEDDSEPAYEEEHYAAQTYSEINQQAAQTIAKASSEVLHDPLLGELFEQLNRPAQDELAQIARPLAGRTFRAVEPPRARRVGAKLESHCWQRELAEPTHEPAARTA